MLRSRRTGVERHRQTLPLNPIPTHGSGTSSPNPISNSSQDSSSLPWGCRSTSASCRPVSGRPNWRSLPGVALPGVGGDGPPGVGPPKASLPRTPKASLHKKMPSSSTHRHAVRGPSRGQKSQGLHGQSGSALQQQSAPQETHRWQSMILLR
jgi:hypothetical protein